MIKTQRPALSSARPWNDRSRQWGLTLVELMVAMTLGLILMAVMVAVYVANQNVYRTQDDNARLHESGRYALELLGRNIREAGFPDRALPVIDRRGPKFDGTAIAGTNGSSSAPDSITLSLNSTIDCLGNTVPAPIPLTVPDNRQAINTFSITANGLLQCDGDGTGPALPQPILGDIEDMQMTYGLDKDDDQAADTYTETPTPTEWAQVVTVRACVLVRTTNDNVATQPQTYLGCNGAAVNAVDRRLRRAFMETFNLRNRIWMAP